MPTKLPWARLGARQYGLGDWGFSELKVENDPRGDSRPGKKLDVRRQMPYGSGEERWKS